jgi:hypothetical protein
MSPDLYQVQDANGITLASIFCSEDEMRYSARESKLTSAPSAVCVSSQEKPLIFLRATEQLAYRPECEAGMYDIKQSSNTWTIESATVTILVARRKAKTFTVPS